MSDSEIAKRSFSLPVIAEENNFLVYPEINHIDEDVGVSNINGGGSSIFPNKIGVRDKPIGTSAPPTWEAWVADDTYPFGFASVACIAGGYDNVNNQLAGFIGGGGHNYLKYNTQSHGVIVGGSHNVVVGGRAVIVGGLYNCIDVNGTYGFIGSGNTNKINAIYSAIVSGLECSVDATFAGVMVGREIVLLSTATYTAAIGRDIEFTRSQSFVLGGEKKEFLSDTQVSLQVSKKTTTNGNLSSCSPTHSLLHEIGKYKCGTCEVKLIGVDPVGNLVTYHKNFAYITLSDTSSRLIDNETGNVVTSSGPTLNLNVGVDQIGCAGVAHVRLTAGPNAVLLIRPYGKASTVVKWTASLSVTELIGSI